MEEIIISAIYTLVLYLSGGILWADGWREDKVAYKIVGFLALVVGFATFIHMVSI